MSPTVLVADDSRTIRKVVEMALKAAPFEVVGVGSGRETMEAAERSPSVILLDYHMPDASGYEVCRALKNNGSTAQIPVIMLGGNHRDFSEDEAREAGADDVVMKPFNTDTLLEAIDALADGASASAQPSAAQPSAAQPSAAQPDQPAAPASSQPSNQPGVPESTPTPTPPPPSREASQPAGGPPSGGPSSGGPSSGEMRGSQRAGEPQAPSDSRPRIPVDDNSGARRPSPRQTGGSQPRLRTGGSQPRMRTEGGSQPRIPDAGGQPKGGSQPRIATPDVNASSRAQDVSSSGAPSAPGGTTSDSGVSNIGMSRAEIETMVREEVKRSVKEQLPGLLRNIMGDVFQKKVLPKLLEHGQQRVDAIVQDRLGEQIREAVRVEIERLLAEE
jgi:CheY-like chemotaxis protein